MFCNGSSTLNWLRGLILIKELKRKVAVNAAYRCGVLNIHFFVGSIEDKIVLSKAGEMKRPSPSGCNSVKRAFKCGSSQTCRNLHKEESILVCIADSGAILHEDRHLTSGSVRGDLHVRSNHSRILIVTEVSDREK